MQYIGGYITLASSLLSEYRQFWSIFH